MRLRIKAFFLSILAVVVFSIKIGSYFPDSMNYTLIGILKKEIPDVSIERITPGALWKYDAVLSPFYEKGFKIKDSLFYFYPAVFKSPRSEKVVLPLKYAVIRSILGSTIDRVPYEVTYLKFSNETLDLLVHLRKLYKDGKIIPLTFWDLDESVRYAIDNGYGVVVPQFLSWMIPNSYERVDCKEFFKLPKACTHVRVNMYSNKSSVSNKILAAVMELKNELKNFELYRENGEDDSILDCQAQCREHMSSLMFLTFFTNKDLKPAVKDFEKAINMRIWRSRFFEKYYIMTYLLIGIFVIFTVDYKMIRYVKHIKSGGRQRDFLYVLAAILVIPSFFGVPPEIDPVISKIFFIPLIVSVAILDIISGNKRWWVPLSINGGVVAAGILNDAAFSVVDIPFLIATFSFSNEKKPLSWIFVITGISFYAAAKRAGHNIYALPALVLSVMIFAYFIREFSRSRKSGWSLKQLDRPIIMFKTMHPIFLLVELFFIFIVFTLSFVWVEANVEKTMYLERRTSVALSNSFEKIAFPCAEISLENGKTIVKVNDPKLKNVRALDMGFMIPKNDVTYFSYIPHKAVVRSALKSSLGYLIIMLTVFSLNLLVYVFLRKLALSSKMEFNNALVRKKREYDEALEKLQKSLKLKEKSWDISLSIIDIFDSNAKLIDVLKSVSSKVADLEFVERVWIAILTENGWISLDGESVTVPIPDLKLDPKNRIAISLKYNGDVYALVFKIKSTYDYEIKVFENLKIALEKFVKFTEGAKG